MAGQGRGDRRNPPERQARVRRTWRGQAAPHWATGRVLNCISEMRSRLAELDPKFFQGDVAVESAAAALLLSSHVQRVEQHLAGQVQGLDRQVLAAVRSLAAGLAEALKQDPGPRPAGSRATEVRQAVRPLIPPEQFQEAVRTGRVLREDIGDLPPVTGTSTEEMYRQLLLYARDLARLYQSYRQLYERLRSMEQTMALTEKAAAAGLLSGGILHDVNHFLTVIQGAAELLLTKRNEFGPEVQEDLEAIVDSARKAATLVHRYQMLSRPGPMETVPFSLADVAASAVGILARQIKKRDITCVLDLNQEVPPVKGDPVALEEVVLNLVRNAIDVLKSGGRIRVAVDAVRREDGGQEVLLLVEDNGPGIPRELHERIFEPFATFREGGSGLGLHIVKSIVERHGGQIRLFSEPGRGAKFLVRLPAASG